MNKIGIMNLIQENEPFNLDSPLNQRGDNEYPEVSEPIFNVTISEQLTAADFPVQIQEFYMNSLFDMGALISYISHCC